MATTSIRQRIDYARHARHQYRAMFELERAMAESPLDPQLYELVKVRASQINGCAYCLHMHTADAREKGVPQLKLDVLAGWRESPAFDEREGAALALCEAMTLIADAGVPDTVWEAAAERFDEGELAALMFGITLINAWNRLAIASETPHAL